MSVREPGTHVEFVMWPVLQGHASKEAGREIYKDEPHVRIRNAGMDKQEFFGPVNERIKERFPEEWAAFEKGLTAPVHGTPVGSWPHLFSRPSMVKNLLSLGFQTVEDIAGAHDAAIQAVGMGGYKMRDEARKFLSSAQVLADTAQLDELREANREKDEMLAEQGRQIASLQEQMRQLMQPQVPAEEAPTRRRRKQVEEEATP